MQPGDSINAGKKPLRIAVDISTLTDGKTGIETSGIQTALIGILNQLQQVDTINEYFLFETRPSMYSVFNKKWETILLPRFLFPLTIWTQLVFPFYLMKYKVDVLWAPKFICPLLSIKKMRIYTTIYDLGYLHLPRAHLLKDKLVMQLLVPLSARRSTAVITDSEYIKRDFEESYRSIKTPVIAVPLGKPDWSLPVAYSYTQRQNFLFFAGNFEPRKNLFNAIKALEILYTRGKSIELQIAFPAEWKSRDIIDYVNSSPIKSNIKLLGYLPLEELKRKYLTCKALLYPSLYEGFGLPVLEALAMDCTVLTSKNTVMQEIAEEAALYFDPQNPCDIAEKINLVYSLDFDRQLYLKHKDAVLKKYTWESAARRMLSLFEATVLE
jgi:glycosyltransferase involved in cell wall biosynthesis